MKLELTEKPKTNSNADVAECCPPLLGEVVSPRDAETAARVFRALGDPARVRLLSVVAASPGREACVCELVEEVPLSQPTVSHHLRVLSEAGILERERRGRWVFYRLVDGPLRVLGDALSLRTAEDPALTATSRR